MRFAAVCGEGRHHLALSSLVRIYRWPVGRRAFAGCLAPSKTPPKSALPQSTATTRCSSYYLCNFGTNSSELLPLYVDSFQAGTHMYTVYYQFIVLQIIKAGSQIWRHEQSVVQDLDIAVVKATNHVECPPKEKHVRSELIIHTLISSPLNFVR